MRRLKNIRGFIAACVLTTAVFAPGCEKVDTELYYNIVGYLDLPDVDTLIYYSRQTKVFVHYVEEEDWTVLSYGDAEKGVITNIYTGERQDPEYEGWLHDNNIMVRVGPFTQLPVMLVAYDTERHSYYQSEMYGWRSVDVQAGISEVRIPVIFAPEKKGTNDTLLINGTQYIREMHVNSRWSMVNDNPYNRDAGEEEEEGEEEEGGEDSGR